MYGGASNATPSISTTFDRDAASSNAVEPIMEKSGAGMGQDARPQSTASFFHTKANKEAAADSEKAAKVKRPTRLFAPVYNGLGAALGLALTLEGLRKLLIEYWTDQQAVRFALVATFPFLFCVSLVRVDIYIYIASGNSSHHPYLVLLQLLHHSRRPIHWTRRAIPSELKVLLCRQTRTQSRHRPEASSCHHPDARLQGIPHRNYRPLLRVHQKGNADLCPSGRNLDDHDLRRRYAGHQCRAGSRA